MTDPSLAHGLRTAPKTGLVHPAKTRGALVAGNRSGFIYVIGECEVGPLKIGRSVDPERRLSGLQTSHHAELAILHRWKMQNAATPAVESLLHSLFKRRRKRGEWYGVFSRDVASVMDLVTAGDNEGAGLLADLIVSYNDAWDEYERTRKAAPNNFSSRSYRDDKAAWKGDVDDAMRAYEHYYERACRAGLRLNEWDVARAKVRRADSPSALDPV